MKTKVVAISYFLFLAVVVYCADSRAHLGLFSIIRSIPGGDKLGHFLLMGGFALLLNLSLNCRVLKVAGKRILLGSVLAFTLITIEECSQHFIRSRTFDLLDLTADYLAVLLFNRLAIVFSRRRSACRAGDLKFISGWH